MRSLLALLAIMAAAPAVAQTVESAEGDWRNIPYVKMSKQYSLPNATINKISAIAERGECPAIGNRRKVDLDMPYMVRFTPQGSIERIVVKRIGCGEVEKLVGAAVLSLAQAGAYTPTGENQAGWYRGAFAFSSSM